jgi:hypothetical protein
MVMCGNSLKAFYTAIAGFPDEKEAPGATAASTHNPPSEFVKQFPTSS